MVELWEGPRGRIEVRERERREEERGVEEIRTDIPHMMKGEGVGGSVTGRGRTWVGRLSF